jgi:hypothetical protein
MCLTKQKVRPILKKSVKALLDQQDRQGGESFSGDGFGKLSESSLSKGPTQIQPQPTDSQ